MQQAHRFSENDQKLSAFQVRAFGGGRGKRASPGSRAFSVSTGTGFRISVSHLITSFGDLDQYIGHNWSHFSRTGRSRRLPEDPGDRNRQPVESQREAAMGVRIQNIC